MDGSRNASVTGEQGAPQPIARRNRRWALAIVGISLGLCIVTLGSLAWCVKMAVTPAHDYFVTRSEIPDRARAIAHGSDFSIAVKPDGTLWSWGDNAVGQLGQDPIATTRTSVPERVAEGAAWAAIAAGGKHSLAIRSDGTLWTWGANAQGQLGDGTLVDRSTPAQVGSMGGWTQVSAGSQHSVALRSDGTLWTWGANGQGQLGTGGTAGSSVPLQVGGDADWTSISAARERTAAVKGEGTLWGWGSNFERVLLDNDLSAVSTPTPLGSGSNWKSVAVFYYSTYGIRRDGSLWEWAWNRRTNADSAHNVLTQIDVGTRWKSVYAGQQQAIAIGSDGTLWAWGYMDPRLGGTLAPERVGKDADWVSAATDPSGLGRACAIKADGSVWTIGLR